MKAIDIAGELAKVTVLEGRTKDTPLEEESDVFAVLDSYRDGRIFAGSFSGEGPWERHQSGDELVHVLEGTTTLTALTEEGTQVFELRRGMVLVVPQGVWHRFRADERVTVLTVTPEPTEHSAAEDPRTGS